MCFNTPPSARRFRVQTSNLPKVHMSSLVCCCLGARNLLYAWVYARGSGGSKGGSLGAAPRSIKRRETHLKRLITLVSEYEETGSWANLWWKYKLVKPFLESNLAGCICKNQHVYKKNIIKEMYIL